MVMYQAGRSPPPLSPEKFLFEGIWKCISVFLMAKFITEKNSFRSCTLKNFTLEGETFINLHSLYYCYFFIN